MKLIGVQQEGPPAQQRLPLFAMVNIGDPPADDHVEERQDIAQLLNVRPDDTFFVRVEGTATDDTSIRPGDVLVVGRLVTPRLNDTVIAFVDGEFIVKVLHEAPRALRLVSHGSPRTQAYDLPFEIRGVVLWIIHKARQE